ncbi:MAG TPA: hypothetical protein VEJ63_12025 [Planctomycetota bacterium]|nr:hypothetical protein [Planctomycetota bacterium]
MPRVFRKIAVFLAFSMAVLSAEDASIDMAFDKTMELLHVQSKLNVLKRFRENEFFIPETWLRLYLDEQQALNNELSNGNKVDIEVLEDWVSETEKVEDAEEDTIEKLAVDWGSKTLKALTEGAGEEDAENKGILTVLREYNQKMADWRLRDKRKAFEVAVYVRDTLAALQPELKGLPQGPLTDAEREWRSSVRALYRGALKDRQDLAFGIKAIERERMYLAGCVKAMKEVNAGLELLEKATSEDGKFDKVLDKAKDLSTKYLQDRYGGDDEATKENIKSSVEKVAGVIKKSKETWEKLSELDKDPLLKANPVALKTCKRLALFSAFFETTIENAKDLTVLAPIKPLFEILDYYAKALALVPKFAQAMQGFVNKVSQDYVDTTLLGAWNVIPGNNDRLERTSLMVHYNLQIAMRGDGANRRYFMLVPEDVAKDGYVLLSQEEYDRLAQAVADERMIFGRKEASRGIVDYIKENGFYYTFTPAEVLSSSPSPAYIEDLKKKARKVPFKEKDLDALARGQAVEVHGRKWTAEQLRARCETEMDLLADEFAVRLALPKFTRESMDEWRKYKGVLAEFKVALTTEQIMRLFTFYESSGSNAEHVRGFLKKTATERALKRRGAARIGIPLISVEPYEAKLQPGKSVKIVAYCVVSDLAPGREIDGTLQWTLPEWAGAVPSQTIKIRNGQIRVERSITIPAKTLNPKFEAKVTLRIPLEEGESVAEASTSATIAGTQPDTVSQPTQPPATQQKPQTPPQPPPVTQRPAQPAVQPPKAGEPVIKEITGNGKFDVEVEASGPLAIIKVERAKRDYRNVNRVEARAEAFAQLDKNEKDSGTGLLLSLYCGPSPDGPWHSCAGSGIVTAFTPIGEDKPNSFGHVEAGRFVFYDQTPEKLGTDKPHKPLYYRLGQQAYSKSQKTGKEVFSPVWKPSTKALVQFDYEVQGPAELKPRFSRGRWRNFVSISAQLTLEEQHFAAHGAHFTYSINGFTGHAYSPRYEEGVFPDKIVFSWANFEFPYVPGGTLTVTAEGEGMTGAGKVKVKADPEQENFEREETEKVKKEFEPKIKAAKDTVKFREDSFNSIQKSTTDSPQYKAYNVAQHQNSFNMAKLELKVVEAEERYRLAIITRNFAQALQERRELLALAKRKQELRLEYANRDIEYAQTNPAKNEAALAKRFVEDKQAQKERVAKEAQDDVTVEYLRLLEPAYFAGDAGSYQEALNQYMAAGRPDMVADKLVHQCAAEWVTLTGDRNQGAALLRKGVAMQLEERKKPFSEENFKGMIGQYPVWWPGDPTKVSDDPKALKESMEKTASAKKKQDARAFEKIPDLTTGQSTTRGDSGTTSKGKDSVASDDQTATKETGDSGSRDGSTGGEKKPTGPRTGDASQGSKGDGTTKPTGQTGRDTKPGTGTGSERTARPGGDKIDVQPGTDGKVTLVTPDGKTIELTPGKDGVITIPNDGGEIKIPVDETPAGKIDKLDEEVFDIIEKAEDLIVQKKYEAAVALIDKEIISSKERSQAEWAKTALATRRLAKRMIELKAGTPPAQRKRTEQEVLLDGIDALNDGQRLLELGCPAEAITILKRYVLEDAEVRKTQILEETQRVIKEAEAAMKKEAVPRR